MLSDPPAPGAASPAVSAAAAPAPGFDQTSGRIALRDKLGNPVFLYVVWSKQPVAGATGAQSFQTWLGAFVLGPTDSLPGMQMLTNPAGSGATTGALMTTFIPGKWSRCTGFFATRTAPDAAPSDFNAFGASVLDALAQFDAGPQARQDGEQCGAMILWLDHLGKFARSSDCGLFFPMVALNKGQDPSWQKVPAYLRDLAWNTDGPFCRLDTGTKRDPSGNPVSLPHRLYDLGCETPDGRLLKCDGPSPVEPNNFGAIWAMLGCDTRDQRNMTLSVAINDSAQPHPLPLTFAGGLFRGVAVTATRIVVCLDNIASVASATPGCLVVTGTTGDALRNFELGFEHSFTAPPPASYRLFHPLLDAGEKFTGAQLSVTLNPIQRDWEATNRVEISLAGQNQRFASTYRTRLDDPLALSASSAVFVSAVSGNQRVYFTPTGTFTLQTSGAPDLVLRPGLSGVEYIGLSNGDRITFVTQNPAGVILSQPLDATGKLADDASFAVDETAASTTAWVTITPAKAAPFNSENDGGPLFHRTSDDAQAPLAYLEASVCVFPAGQATPAAPLLPYAAGVPALDGSPDLTALAAAFESSYVAPLRLQELIAPQTTSAPGIGITDQVTAVTPQGYLATFVGGALRCVTLGQINNVPESSGWLRFGQDPATNPGAPALPAEVTRAFLANQQFIVITAQPDATGLVDAQITLSNWKFDLTLPQKAASNTPGAYRQVLVVKSAQGTLRQLAASPASWTAYPVFNNTGLDASGQFIPGSGGDPHGDFVSQWLVDYFNAADQYAAAGLSQFQALVDILDDANWNGFLHLSVAVSGDLPREIQFLTSGLGSDALRAHHLGCSVNRTQPDATGKNYTPSSSYFGLIHYARPGSDPTQGGSPPFVPGTLTYDFQLLTLEAKFECSAISHFSSSAQLVLNELFGESIASTSPDPSVSATNALRIIGSMQTSDGAEHYAFAMPKGSACTFFPNSAAFERIEIDRAVVTVPQTGSKIARFVLSGWFGLQTLADFDLLSYAAIGFDGLNFYKPFDPQQSEAITVDESGVLLAKLPPKTPDQLPVTADEAGAATLFRPGSLAEQFPLAVSRLVVGAATQSPVDLGYRALTISGGSALAANTAWYGLELDLPLGSAGGLASGELLTAKFLLAWNPGGADVAFQPFFRLDGPGGVNLTFSLQGVLKVGAEDIALWRVQDQALLAKNITAYRYVLQLANIGVSILGKSFPPRGTTNLLIAGMLDAKGQPVRQLGWFGAYAKAKSETPAA